MKFTVLVIVDIFTLRYPLYDGSTIVGVCLEFYQLFERYFLLMRELRLVTTEIKTLKKLIWTKVDIKYLIKLNRIL